MQQRPHIRLVLSAVATAVGLSAACGGGAGPDLAENPATATVGAGGTTTQGTQQTGTGTGGAAGAQTTPTTTATTKPPSDTGTIIPLYAPPSDESWAAVVAAKRAHPSVPVYAVVNPANGPGTAYSADYRGGTDALAAAGIKVLGYVFTGYAARDQGAAKADIDTWHAWYPAVSGIFFDEQSYEDGHDGYYRALKAHAATQGLQFTVGNPGVDTKPSMVGATDVTLIYESQGLPDVSRLQGWHSQYPRKNFGVIPHSTGLDASWVRAARQAVGYIYVTDHTMPNPWYGVTSQLQELLAALE